MISGISALEKNFKTGLFKSSSHCYFGFPDGSVIDAQPLQKIPRKIEGLHFYAAEGVCELISELKNKGVFEEISYLSIACSFSDTLSQDLLDQFDSVNLTKLQIFDLGAARYYCETHDYYKNLGDITGLLAKATKLRSLNINGTFLISKPINYGNLTYLDICLENFDTCQNSGPITDQTLDYLISGNTPELEVLIIDVECEDSDRKYTLSNDFLSGKKLPNIQRLELCGKFTDQSIERIEGGFYKDKLQASFHTEDMHA